MNLTRKKIEKGKRPATKPVIQNVKSSDEKEAFMVDSFQRAVWPVLAMGQVFGLLPVYSISSPNPHKVAFHWCSMKTLHALTCCFFGMIQMVVIWGSLVSSEDGLTAKNIVGVVFNGVCAVSFFLFLLLAKRWKCVAVMWFDSEQVFLGKSYRMPGWTLAKKVRIAAFSVISMGIIEHGLFLVSNINNYFQRKLDCPEINNDLRAYFESEYLFVFHTIPYNPFFGFMIWWLNYSLTFCWNFLDVFIIVISIGLTTRYGQISHRLEQFRGQAIFEQVWDEIRVHHVQLCELLDFVDNNLAIIIFLSCGNDLYFICIQLLNIFDELPYFLNKVYFYYSLIYLIGRTVGAFLCAAAIHDAAQKPLDYIRSVSTSHWSPEIDRFAEQMASTQIIALSGMRFFHMTRKLLFGMAGSIVTYELVLLQINSVTKKAVNTTAIVCQLRTN